MNKLSLIPLYRWEFKLVGMAVFMAAVMMNFFAVMVTQYSSPLMILAYVLIIFSKERVENDDTLRMRYTAFKACLLVFLAVSFSVTLINGLYDKQMMYEPFFISTVLVVCYLVIYYTLLLFRFGFSSEDLAVSFKTYRRFYFIYIISLLLLCFYALFGI